MNTTTAFLLHVLEAHQDRARESAERLARAVKRHADRATETRRELNELYRMQIRKPTKIRAKQIVELERIYGRARARADELHERVYPRKRSGDRYGHAKASRYVYLRGLGWQDPKQIGGVA